MSNQIDLLSEKYTIDTPEHVSFGYQVAGIGNRFIAALLDSVILVLLVAGLNILLVVMLTLVSPQQTISGLSEDEIVSWAGGLVLALYSLINFLLIWGYYVLFEWLWNGQTPGKRTTRIRVVEMDGSPASLVAILVRNLVRVVDFLPAGYGVGLVTMFVDRHARRLGDFAAGTLVVKGHREVDLAAVLTGSRESNAGQVVMDKARQHNAGSELEPSSAIEQRFAGLRRLTVADRDLIAELLYRHERGQAEDDLVLRIARVIAHKIGHEPPVDSRSSRTFLDEVAEAYRHFADRSSS